MRSLIFLSLAAPLLFAQPQPPPYPPKSAPAFTPGDADGLVITPNPKIRVAWLRPVHWRADGLSAHPIDGLPAPSASERAQMIKTLDALSAALKATPEGTRGLGFWVNESRHVMGQGRNELPVSSVPAAQWPLPFTVGIFPFYHEDILQANGQWRTSVRGETESISYRFNS